MKKILQKTKINKLTTSNFYDVYGISLLSEKTDLSDKYILSLLLPIAEKYVNITLHAMRCELRYFKRGTESNIVSEPLERNIDILKQLNVKNWKKERLTLNIEKILRCFSAGDWNSEYGGEKWANICKNCIELESYIKLKDIPKICQAIDYLNDLEHNNACYLKDYCTFNLEMALDFKWNCEEQDIFRNCSDGVRELLNFKKG